MKNKVLPLTLSALISGCGSTHLLYVHDLNVGINVSGGTDSLANVTFGYDRRNYAIVPKKGDKGDAMSLAGTSCVYSNGLQKLEFNHFISTGKTAEHVAKLMADDSTEMARLRTLVQGGEKCSR